MDAAARKRELRRASVQRILGLAPEARRAEQNALVRLFDLLPGYNEAETVLLYATAFPEEIDTFPMIRGALAAGKNVVLPRVDRASKSLRLFRVRDLDRDLTAGTLGIPEPSRSLGPVDPSLIDWALVPGLLFDERCFRVGRGAGHYDRLLPLLRPDAPRWALAFDCQWALELPVEPHDVPLDGVVSLSKSARR